MIFLFKTMEQAMQEAQDDYERREYLADNTTPQG